MSQDVGGPRESRSYWMDTSPGPRFEPLAEDQSVDVAVVGGGITGLTTALHLVEAGRSVSLVEADRIGSGTSGHTTAKLTSQHGLVYRNLVETFGRSKAKQYADANQAAIEEVDRRIDELGIDAPFERRPSYIYATRVGNIGKLKEEERAARQLNLPAEYVEEPDGPFEMAGALRFRDQASFHPRRYLLALAEAIEQRGGHVFEGTRATDLSSGPPARVTTDRGSQVMADDVVLASLFPVFDRTGYFARMHPSMAYLLVVELDDDPPAGMYLSADEPPWTFRPLPSDGRSLLLVGGQSHKTMQGSTTATERYRRCAAFAREYFPVSSIEYRWSAHDYIPVDGVPYIGRRDPVRDNVFVGTGFNKWGMTGGTAAGIILADLVTSGSHPWAEVFDPLRVVPSASLSLLRENASVGKRWVGDRITHAMSSSQDEIPDRGNGAVITRRGRPMGVYCDDDGELTAVSAVCPHLWCVVEWNDADRTWDCPCHGSRFDLDGSVRDGPAITDLPPRDL